MTTLRAARIHVSGLVQGVGFRPFVYRLAAAHGLGGWVRNTSGGVEIEVEGAADGLEAFARGLREEAPPLADVNGVEVVPCAVEHRAGFRILASQAQPDAFQPVAADVAVCDACLRELFDPADRRYRYPFINCTHCGPRLTLITGVPYDRPNTTMASFPLCPACAAEYGDPLNRRFHAQPVACPDCGPSLWFVRTGHAGEAATAGEAALAAARSRLAAGGVVAIKGLGGFHLACDATDEAAVDRLRARKQRLAKPLALMVPDLATAEALCEVSAEERALLEGRERPIVVLRRKPGTPIAASVAPGQTTLGVMLPYTPLHHLLLERAPGFPLALVMTSGNLSEEPLVSDNAEALARLAGIADAWLLHNRDIHTRCDDSVVRLVAPGSAGRPTQRVLLRRARGYAPQPVHLPRDTAPLLATGAELKNTFCLARGRLAFLSPHIGDLKNFEMLLAFENGVALYEQLFGTRPEALAYDLHPDYLSTRYALERAEREGLPACGIQHHHAHIAACLADHGLSGERPVIGLACDGTGYGSDGAIWGGEFLIADYATFERPLHLAYVPLPGGEAAVREPWRMALAWLRQAGVAWETDLPPVRHALAQKQNGPLALAVMEQQLRAGLNAPLTSSLGRLFDAVASLVGVRQAVAYEGQAAIELETLVVDDAARGYAFEVGARQVEAAPVVAAVAADVRAGVPARVIAARFHAGVAEMLLEVCRRLRAQTGLREVALSGGVWQNGTLLRLSVARLERAGFDMYTHRQVPANDGGLALGQAAIAATWLRGAAWPATRPQLSAAPAARGA
jgi:hydrogenase maturation protein HypF